MKISKVEKAKAGHLSLKMNDNIGVDLTVTKRSGIGRFSFDNLKYGTLIIGTGINSSPENIKDAVRLLQIQAVKAIHEVAIFYGTESDYKIFLQLNLIDLLHIMVLGKKKNYLLKK